MRLAAHVSLLTIVILMFFGFILAGLLLVTNPLVYKSQEMESTIAWLVLILGFKGVMEKVR